MLDDDSDPTLPNTITITDLPFGEYIIDEAVAWPFQFQNVTCSVLPYAGSPITYTDQGVIIDLYPLDEVVCTFTNEANLMPTIQPIPDQVNEVGG